MNQQTTILLALATAGLVTALSMSEMQIQPAYSQAEHCTTIGIISKCITPGQDPSSSICLRGFNQIDLRLKHFF
jgi:hypothetical protein